MILPKIVTRLSLTKRMAVVVAMLLFPLGLMISKVYKANSGVISTAEKEILGVNFIESLSEAYVAFWDFALAARHRSGSTDTFAKLDSYDVLAKKIAKLRESFSENREGLLLDVASMRKVNASAMTIEEVLGAVGDFGTQQKFSAAMSGQVVKVDEWFRSVFVYVSNTSGLILDPDLDSFYTMIALTLHLPKMVSALGRIQTSLNFGADLAYLKGLLHESFSEYAVSLNTAMVEDGNFWGEIDGLKQAFSEQLKGMQSVHDQFYALDEKNFPTNREQSVSDLSQVFGSLEQGMNKLLAARIEGAAGDRASTLLMNLGLTLLALVMIVFLIGDILKRTRLTTTSLLRVSKDLQTAGNVLHAGSDEGVATVSRQTAAIQEAVSALSEMTSMLGQTSQHASNTAQLAVDMADKASHGRNTMMDLQNALADIAESGTRIKEMRRVIAEVATKTQVINEIVFKTQLLAVNASIEAARAGHHGKGFAVVANEVGNLATLSGRAADEIRSLVEQSTTKVDDIVGFLGDRIERSGKVGAVAIESFEFISQAIFDISNKVKQIDEASREQHIGVKQTGQAMTELNDTASVTSRNAQQSLHQSKNVLEIVKSLTKVANEFNAMLLGVERQIALDTVQKREPRELLAETEPMKVGTIQQANPSMAVPVSMASGGNRLTSSAGIKAQSIIKKLKGSSSSGGVKLASDSPDGNAKSKFLWHEKLDIGVPSMNEAHKHLLEIMRRLEAAYESGQSFRAQLEIVNELGAYATKHFKEEEAYMQSIKYDDFDNHRLIHQNLLSRYGALVQEFQNNGKVSEEFFGFLRAWLVAHIMGVDMKYGEFTQGELRKVS